MSRELERRIIKMEAKHHAANGLDARISRMSDDELTTAIRACAGQLAAEVGHDWREWLAEHDPATEGLYRQLEREGAEL